MSAIRCMSGNWTGPGSTIECVLPAGRSRSVRRAAETQVTVTDGLCPQRPWLPGPAGPTAACGRPAKQA